MVEGFISRRLSGKLLLMTMTDRAQQAGLLAQALTGVPDYEASEILTAQFMQDTDVIMMSAKRDGMSEFMLGQPPEIGGFRPFLAMPKVAYVSSPTPPS